MQDEASGVRRRDLLSLIGAMAGSAAMYHAMTSLGFAVGVALSGPDQARRRSEGRLRADPRRGARRHDGRAGIAQRRLQGAGAGIQCARRRPQLDLARRRQLHRARRLHAKMRVRGRALHQSRPMADSLSSPRAAGLLQAAQRRAGILHPAQPQRLSACRARLRRRAAAHPQREGGLPGPDCGAAREVDQTGPARRGRHQGGSGNPAAGAALLGRARPQLQLQGQSVLRRNPRLRHRARRRAHRDAGAERSRCAVRYPEIAGLALFAEFRQLQFPDHHVPAGRRHGHDRQGVRARGRRPHPLQCQGDGDRAERSRRHRELCRHDERGRTRRPRPPTGASAPFRSRS